MKKIIKKSMYLMIVFMLIAILAVYNYNNNSIAMQTNADVLSNTKIGWGVKRAENHIQPDLGKKNTELMQKYDGIYMENNEKKYVYLTFDEGYEAGYTEKILDTLKEKEVKATFFITAHYVNTAAEIVQRMIDERAYDTETIFLNP